MQGNVFIVEDNEWLVCMYRSIFKTMDCCVTHASTTSDAVRLLHGMKTDLIIIDDRLPDGSGIDVTHEFRFQLEESDTPIIYTTSQLSTLDERALQSAGYASVVTKPLDIGAFSALVRRYVGNRSPTDARA